jgi:hypothetical protein
MLYQEEEAQSDNTLTMLSKFFLTLTLPVPAFNGDMPHLRPPPPHPSKTNITYHASYLAGYFVDLQLVILAHMPHADSSLVPTDIKR